MGSLFYVGLPLCLSLARMVQRRRDLLDVGWRPCTPITDEIGARLGFGEFYPFYVRTQVVGE